MNMKIWNFALKKWDYPGLEDVEHIANFEYEFYRAQVDGKFDELDNIAKKINGPEKPRRYESIFLAAVSKYPSQINNYTFISPQQKLFVICMLGDQK